MKRFIQLDDENNEVGTVEQAFVLGDSAWPEEPEDRCAGLTFEVTITPENDFRVAVLEQQRQEADRRGGAGPLNARIARWCRTGRAQFWLSPDPESATVICRDPDEPTGGLFNR